MSNISKMLKMQAAVNEKMKILKKLKEDSIYDYKWYGLACASGLVNSQDQLVNPLAAIKQAKEFFSHITTEEQLDELLCSYEQHVRTSVEKTLGKNYKIIAKTFDKIRGAK